MTALLAVYIALRLLIPPGFMLSPEALAEGSIRVTICDGYGTREVAVDRDGNILDPQHDEERDRDSYCDFALATAVAHLPPAQGLLAIVDGDEAPPPLAGADPVAAQAQGPPLGSRAPPRA